MKNFVATLLICMFVVLTCAITPAFADTETDSEDTLIVGVPIDRCPVFYQDEDTGEIVGIGVDLMRSAATDAGYSVCFVCVKEPTLKEALDNETYDVVMPFGSAVKSASGKDSIVSENLMQTPFTLVTKNNAKLPPLNEIHVGMLHSLAAGADTVQQMYPNMEITLYDTMPDCVEALRAGKVDGLLHNSYVWSYVLQKPAYSDLKVQPGTMFSMDFRVATLDTPEGQQIIDRLNGGIDSLTDTRKQAITLDYTSRKLYQYNIFDYVYQYGTIVLLVVLIIAIIILAAMMKNRAIKTAHEEKLRQVVEYDSLTGALSLDGFRKRGEELLRLNPDIPYIMSYINIKNFKYINDSLGREAGDKLLKFWVDTISKKLTDKDAIGRVTADRFVILRQNEGIENLRQEDEEVFDPVRNFFINQGDDHRIIICGGIYILTLEDHRKANIDHLIDFARIAEKKVRDTQSGGYAFYNPEQWERGKQNAEIVNYLPAAIESESIHVWYQPQVNYETGEITGAEALCRIDHDKLGFLYPDDFINVLEETGLVYELDKFVWDKVCQDLKRWNEQGHHRSISVNVSRCDIQEDRNIPKHFQNLIQTYDLTPDQLHIEITETAYVERPDLLIDITMKLQELGFRVEMDDFGSGYSSLHMLKEVPVDRIKLDLHFLSDSGDADKGRTIVSCMIKMIKLLDIDMIVEGVETVEQADFLRENGCSDIQGYYFYKPMPVEDFEKVMVELNAKEHEIQAIA